MLTDKRKVDKAWEESEGEGKLYLMCWAWWAPAYIPHLRSCLSHVLLVHDTCFLWGNCDHNRSPRRDSFYLSPLDDVMVFTCIVSGGDDGEEGDLQATVFFILNYQGGYAFEVSFH